MRKNTIAFLAGTSILVLSAFTIVDDIIARLGMKQTEAKRFIFGNMLADFYYFPNGDDRPPSHGHDFQIPFLKVLPEVAKGDKVGAAKELCAYVKMYCNSEDFMNEYTRYRNGFRPADKPAPDENVKKANDNLIKMYKEQIPMYEKYLADARKAKDATSINLYEKGLKDMKKAVADLEDLNPERTIWEKKYPVNPASFVKARLEEYLSLVATVDFDAKLTPKGSKMIFVNPDYERKSKKWKAIFRAGREVNHEVTAFVKEWLKGEIVASVKTKMPVYPEDNIERNATGQSKIINSTNNVAATDTISNGKKQGVEALRNRIRKVVKHNL
jgi:hypothetical protein